MKDVNVRAETIKLLEEKKGRILGDINQKNPLQPTSKGNGNKNKSKQVGPN